MKRARSLAAEAGESLLELTIAIAVLGIGVVSVLGAVLIAADASSLDSRQVKAQSLLHSWAEKVTTATYTPCATSSTYQTNAPYSGLSLPSLPSGFTATYGTGVASDVQIFNGTAFVNSGPGCTDLGVQRVRLTMTVASQIYPGFVSNLWVTVRKPCSSPGGCP